jgi:hypothetical protein
MRRESLYLNDIVEAADHIAEVIAGTDFDGFQKSELLAVLSFRNWALSAKQPPVLQMSSRVTIPRCPGPKS